MIIIIIIIIIIACISIINIIIIIILYGKWNDDTSQNKKRLFLIVTFSSVELLMFS